jgi:cytochrome b561
MREKHRMNWKNTADRYGMLSITMHWLMLALLVAVYACILLHEEFPRGSETRAALTTWHFMLGLSVFALVVARLAIRLAGPTPAVEPPIPTWQHHLASLMHVALYLFLLAMPLLGWLILSTAGKPIPFFGLELPALWTEHKALSRSVKDIHETIAEIGYWLVGLHAAAALFHHYYVRDNTLLRMLPGRARPLNSRNDKAA